MRVPLALLLLPAMLAVNAAGCGSKTPVDRNYGTDAGAGFDAPAREVHPSDGQSDGDDGSDDGGDDGGGGQDGGDDSGSADAGGADAAGGGAAGAGGAAGSGGAPDASS